MVRSKRGTQIQSFELVCFWRALGGRESAHARVGWGVMGRFDKPDREYLPRPAETVACPGCWGTGFHVPSAKKMSDRVGAREAPPSDPHTLNNILFGAGSLAARFCRTCDGVGRVVV